ncbi:protein LTV1 homolog isoform X1 [Schistocerca nitens]|uniref:protein LTV1 homolog isoform X1 n=1 Tax=Schistocerca nitens TaxID=7011 RepID=UPI002118F851|nr:protein LTV1 homolog isoform X1 [Schistocerca nitens]
MPKAKKKFIDRKNAVTFHLVHRSQQDPLIADETAPQHVLVPAAEKRPRQEETEKRKEEQRKYGIFFDDDYDYLQHLKEVSCAECVWEPVSEKKKTKEEKHPSSQKQNENLEESLSQVTKIYLPSSVFASEIEEEIGMLNKAAPQSGLRLELDPDVVAAMDDDFDFDDPENQLEDNFVELANAVDSNEEDKEYDSDDTASTGDSLEETEEEEDENDEICSLPGSEFTFAEEETKSRFTNYSMSSSVIRRNEQLTLLDGRFEKMFADYDDSEIGALDCEEIEGYIPPDSDILLECAKEFEKEKNSQLNYVDKTLKILEKISSDSEDGDDMVKIEVKDKDQEKWDCESILSTYSNIYNHPKLIPDVKPSKHIRVSKRTGIPLDVLGNNTNKLTPQSLARFDAAQKKNADCDGSESVISVLSTLSIRSKDETPEQRKERKRMLKEYRRERRLEKKANAIAFKEEKKRQEKVLLNNKLNQQGVKIL